MELRLQARSLTLQSLRLFKSMRICKSHHSPPPFPSAAFQQRHGSLSLKTAALTSPKLLFLSGDPGTPVGLNLSAWHSWGRIYFNMLLKLPCVRFICLRGDVHFLSHTAPSVKRCSHLSLCEETTDGEFSPSYTETVNRWQSLVCLQPGGITEEAKRATWVLFHRLTPCVKVDGRNNSSRQGGSSEIAPTWHLHNIQDFALQNLHIINHPYI